MLLLSKTSLRAFLNFALLSLYWDESNALVSLLCLSEKTFSTAFWHSSSGTISPSPIMLTMDCSTSSSLRPFSSLPTSDMAFSTATSQSALILAGASSRFGSPASTFALMASSSFWASTKLSRCFSCSFLSSFSRFFLSLACSFSFCLLLAAASSPLALAVPSSSSLLILSSLSLSASASSSFLLASSASLWAESTTSSISSVAFLRFSTSTLTCSSFFFKMKSLSLLLCSSFTRVSSSTFFLSCSTALRPENCSIILAKLAASASSIAFWFASIAFLTSSCILRSFSSFCFLSFSSSSAILFSPTRRASKSLCIWFEKDDEISSSLDLTSWTSWASSSLTSSFSAFSTFLNSMLFSSSLMSFFPSSSFSFAFFLLARRAFSASFFSFCLTLMSAFIAASSLSLSLLSFCKRSLSLISFSVSCTCEDSMASFFDAASTSASSSSFLIVSS
mmetsp:Transcript_19601/g.40648  ORF Transcript_19601/g.40648 Transcript_19601/m.40648 type:complete len:450 (-) Transcript_19601:3036-4385(-)